MVENKNGHGSVASTRRLLSFRLGQSVSSYSNCHGNSKNQMEKKPEGNGNRAKEGLIKPQTYLCHLA